METVQVDHLTSSEAGETLAVENGDPLGASSMRCSDEVSTAMNGQLEIEIPAGDARQGAIHTIQLQSPGGNTHIVEGLVVTSAAGPGGEMMDGETTTLFHSAQTGAFLLPTSTQSHSNNLTSSTLVTSSTSPSTQYEVITADSQDHHILSGLQVVRVTTGENGETIFLVPSSATGDKDGMQQVMVLQSAEDIQEENAQVPQEMVEESVELNIPSPKPVLTTVKQEMGHSCSPTEAIQQHQQYHQPTTTLVVVTGGDGNNGQPQSSAPPPQAQPPPPIVEQKPIIAAANGPTTTTSTPVVITTPVTRGAAAAAATTTAITPNGGIVKPDDTRPKRKAALKAVATRKAAMAIVSPKKQSSPKKPATPRNKVTEVATAPVTLPKNTSTAKSSNSSIATANTATFYTSNAKHVIRETSTLGTSNSTLAISTVPPPISTPSTSRVLLPSGTTIQGTPRSFFLLPEDVVSESDDEGDGSPQRKCVVCLRRRRFTEDIFEMNKDSNHIHNKQQLLQHMDVLISQINIPTRGKPSEVGVCTNCLDSLQRWHIFNSAIKKRHETLRSSGAPFDDTPINSEQIETRLYRNFRKMSKVKEVYQSATHSHLTRRIFTEKDWDFFCDHLFRFNSVKSERARELERYIMTREKLTHIYCVKCQRLVKNGKKGFVKHMKTQHPHEPVMFPCDICGNHFPDKDMTSAVEEYYPHWISHFYLNSCEICGKRFPTKRGLGQHRHSVHKNRTGQWNSKSQVAPTNEDRPWKCDQCDASFKMKGALVSHRDVVHFNLKNHVCTICGEAFKSASSLRGHVRRHEGRRDYKCEVCHKEYYTYSALKGHKVVHQTARDFICGICGKAFKKKKALEEHGTLHTGVKPHRCPICGREIRVKSNLYKHMKIHKKNAELGITSGRGRTQHQNSSPPVVNHASSSTSASSSSVTTPTASSSSSSAKSAQNKRSLMPVVKEEGPKIKQIKVEDRIIEVKQEPGLITHLPHGSMKTANNGNVTSSPMQGATAVDVVLENAELAGGEHRGPIVVSIVTDGLGGGPGNILQMNPEQQAQLLSAVTSLANSQGQSVTVAASPLSGTATAFLASPLQSTPTTGVASIANAVVSSSSATNQDPILGVSTTQFYNTQQFFTSLDQLQN